MKEDLFRGAEAKCHVSGLCCLEGEGSLLPRCWLTLPHISPLQLHHGTLPAASGT